LAVLVARNDDRAAPIERRGKDDCDLRGLQAGLVAEQDEYRVGRRRHACQRGQSQPKRAR
jgi:hypothetical protein